MKMVMGGETEYAISALDVRSRAVGQSHLLAAFFDHARKTLGYTSSSGRGRFLRNGSLIYLDAGLHIEASTPEVTSPFDVVRYLKAGDTKVLDLARSFKQSSPGISDLFCSRANVDYLSGTLWAAHESYMHRAMPEELPWQLFPFLASRVILGAGGWDYQSPALRFTLSPRAHFITELTDCDSQYVRPLFHTKDEPLSGTGTRRLHVACSESLCSDTANVLRFGSTALVLAIIERGDRPGTDVTLSAPIRALQRFALDPECRMRASLVFGGRMTAIALQRHYLKRVECYLAKGLLPDWAERVCVLWRRVLDDLERGPAHVEATLDWAIKRRLFMRHLARRGVAWSALPIWHAALTRVEKVWNTGRRTLPFSPELILKRQPALATVTEQVAPLLARHGLSWPQLPHLLSARYELFELDAKFAALDERGIFNALDAAGALRHVVPGAEMTDALERPPQDTRARIRGEVVRRLSEAGTSYGAEWTGIYDRDNGRELDLSDPLETEERWRDMPVARRKPLLSCSR